MVSYETFVKHFYSNKPNSKTFKSFLKNARVLSSNKTLVPLIEYIKNKKVTIDDINHIYLHICERELYLERFYKKSLEIPENIHFYTILSSKTTANYSSSTLRSGESLNIKISDLPNNCDNKCKLNCNCRQRETGLPLIKIPPMPPNKLDNNQLVNYKNVIRNMFWLEILKKTKSGFPNILSFFEVLENLYKEEIIDYKLLTPSAISYIKDGRIGSVFSSFYFRASIMNPYLVYSLAKSVLYKYLFSELKYRKTNLAKVFTPTLGWCSYLYGFAETGMLYSYTGIDVIPSVCKKTFQFAKENYPSVLTQIACCPSEDLFENPSFVKKHKGQYNIVFFSPPYFRLELYEGKMQSTTRYENYQQWLFNYWEKTVQLCHLALENGGIMCYILSGYGSEDVRKKENFGGENFGGVGNKYLNKNEERNTFHLNDDFTKSVVKTTKNVPMNLIKDMNDITKKYFTFVKMYNMYNKNVHSTKHAKTDEKIIIFYK
jgi:hypothetical protein